MAKHKAPTQVTIAPLAEKSGFEEAVSRYWKPAALVFVIAAGAVIFLQVSQKQQQVEGDNSWNDLMSQVDVRGLTIGSELPAPEDLAPVAQQLEGSIAGPWARAIEVQSLIEAERFDQGRSALAALRQDYPNHPLVKARLRLEKDGDPQSVLERVDARASSIQAFKKSRTALQGPPEVAENAPRVRLDTSRGPIVVGLYPDRAPKHVENFLQLCRDSYYDGTRFHRVLENLLIQGGDPDSRDEEKKDLWGQGGPDHTVPPEVTDAWHFEGILAAAKKGGDIESSGSQFYITASPAHQFDKRYTVFGRVLEGLDLVVELSGEVSAQSDRPENPVVLESATVL